MARLWVWDLVFTAHHSTFDNLNTAESCKNSAERTLPWRRSEDGSRSKMNLMNLPRWECWESQLPISQCFPMFPTFPHLSAYCAECVVSCCFMLFPCFILFPPCTWRLILAKVSRTRMPIQCSGWHSTFSAPLGGASDVPAQSHLMSAAREFKYVQIVSCKNFRLAGWSNRLETQKF